MLYVFYHHEKVLGLLTVTEKVLTTYAVLESAFRKQHSGFKRKGKIIKEKSPVHQMHWSRVIVRPRTLNHQHRH